jgi:phosphomevalonate kinase
MPDRPGVFTASAPGKLVLAGEYAVLDGAPAVCLALDRRARAEIAPVQTDVSVVRAPGYTDTTGHFRHDAGHIDWLDGGTEFGLVGHVWREAGASLSGNWSIELDTTSFRDIVSGQKLGLGSSAAATVALAGACCAAAGCDARSTAAAFAAHRSFQQGLGSGVDVACSSVGGLVAYSTNGQSANRLPWPDGLHIGVVWVGAAADTREKLERLGRVNAMQSRAALASAARRMAAAWAAGQPQAILDEYRDYSDALHQFSVDHGLGIFDAGHAELSMAASGTGVIYKPCGAGGGDVGMVLGTDHGEVKQFIKLAASMNIRQVDVHMDTRGLVVSRGDG